MSEAVSELAMIFRQVQEARLHLDHVACIRVTGRAMPGAITGIVASPERQRLLRGRVDPNLTVRDLCEILVHPDDWDELLASPRIRPHLPAGSDGRIERLLGVPVEFS